MNKILAFFCIKTPTEDAAEEPPRIVQKSEVKPGALDPHPGAAISHTKIELICEEIIPHILEIPESVEENLQSKVVKKVKEI